MNNKLDRFVLSIRNNIGLYLLIGLYLFVNVLFVDKYVSRVFSYAYIVDIVYIFFVLSTILFIIYICKKRRIKLSVLVFFGVLYSIVMGIVQCFIDPMALQVDRWSAIHNFIATLFAGQYPYLAQTHLGGYGSPFPVWQVCHIPFYLLGNVGLSVFVAFGIFIYTLYRCQSSQFAFIVMILLFLSPCYAYEILVRSDLITNFIVVCTSICWLIYKNIQIEKSLVIIACLCGLFASTRLSAVIPIGILYGYDFMKLNLKKQVIFLALTLLIFVATFIPFIVWNCKELLFFQYNPFVLQTRQGSWITMILFLCVFVGVVARVKNQKSSVFEASGLVLFALVCITFTINMVKNNNILADLYSSAFDITYFNMAIPFIITAITLRLDA